MTTSITDKQLTILLLLYKFRFLTRPQLQTMMHHKSFNRIILWLNDLTDKQYITRTYTRTIGNQAKPALYSLNLKSRHLLRQRKDVNGSLLNRLYREKQRSQGFIDHCIILGDIFVALNTFTETNQATLHFSTKTELTGMKYMILPIPDAYFAIEETNGNIKRYFLEVVDEGAPRFVLRKRIQQYLDYYEAQYWQNHTDHPFPEVMLVCPNKTLLNFLHKYIAEVIEENGEDISFYLTTKDEIKTGMKKEIWKKVI